MKFFSYDENDGFKLHETEEAAKRFAENALSFEREDAVDEWNYSVTYICWGEIKQKALETMRRKTFIGDEVDFGLVDV